MVLLSDGSEEPYYVDLPSYCPGRRSAGEVREVMPHVPGLESVQKSNGPPGAKTRTRSPLGGGFFDSLGGFFDSPPNVPQCPFMGRCARGHPMSARGA